ncbi:MAG: hypothetical protein Q8N04_03110 [Nitrospira sp.]|nr:hypothetical protein [Nitrospira sp.]
MLGFAKVETDLIAVEDSPEVQAADRPLREAQATQEQTEAEEQRLIQVVTSDVHRASDDRIEEAHQRLAIRKGSQSSWHLPEAQTAREETKAHRAIYQAAVSAARIRLEDAGKEQLKRLLGQLSPLIMDVQRLAGEIEALRQRVGDCGGDLGEHPCPVLLPGQLVSFQMELAKAKGLL